MKRGNGNGVYSYIYGMPDIFQRNVGRYEDFRNAGRRYEGTATDCSCCSASEYFGEKDKVEIS